MKKNIYNVSDLKFMKGEHPKFTENIVMMLSASIMPYYAEFATFMNFYKSENIPTCGVNVSADGMNFYWSKKFVDSLYDTEAMFLLLHEEFHLLFDHTKRSITYNKELSNTVQDMIINQIIKNEIIDRINTSKKTYITIPKHHNEFILDDDGNEVKDENGNSIPDPNYNHNSALFVPIDYTGELIFENLYQFIKEKQYEYKKRKEEQNKDGEGQDQQGQSQQGQGQGKGKGQQNQNGQGKGQSNQKGKGQGQPNQNGGGSGDDGEQQQDQQGQGQGKGNPQLDSSGKPSYGPYGQNGVDCHSLDSIFDRMEKGEQLTLDSHLNDEVQESARKTIVGDFMQKLKNRGLQSGDVEAVLNKLRKSKTNYLKEIKRTIANHIIGTNKKKSITRPNRRGIEGIKGKKKYKNVINCILDTSGSMGGDFERVLSYIFQNDIHINLIQIDTEVKHVENIRNKRDLEKMRICGLGGTVLQPAVNYITDPKNKLNNFSVIILSDGYTDELDFSLLKKKSLILSTGVHCPMSDPKGLVKSILIDKDESIYG